MAETYNLMSMNACSNCNVHRHQSQKANFYQPASFNACSMHPAGPLQNIYPNGQPPPQNHQMNYGYPPLPQLPPAPQSHHYPAIPHSKSLEHYVDHSLVANNFMSHNRHSSSFDQPTYDHNSRHHYDAVDGGYQPQFCSHAAYNVSGNRYPIPVNISNQFSAGQYQTSMGNGIPCSSAGAGSVYSANPMQNHWHKPDPNNYSDPFYNNNCAGAPSGSYNKRPDDRYYNNELYDNHSTNTSNPSRPNNVRVEHLVDVDDHRTQPINQAYSIYNNLHTNTEDQEQVYENRNSGHRKSVILPDIQLPKSHSRHKSDSTPMVAASYAQAVKQSQPASTTQNSHSAALHRDLQNLHIADAHENPPGRPIYASVMPVDPVLKNKNDKFARNAKLLAEYDEPPTTNGSRHSRASDFDSFEDGGDYSNTDNRSQTVSKNHDGVGSFETWNFVYQKLEKQGYSKDLGERVDLSVQGLDLNPPGIGVNSGDKKLARAQEHVNKSTPPPPPPMKTRNGESRQAQEHHFKENTKITRSVPVSASAKYNGDATEPLAKGVQSRKSENTSSTKVSTSKTDNNEKYRQSGTLRKPRDASAKSSKSTRSSSGGGGGVGLDTSGAAEWSCKFCTFLNPNSIRICSICAKSKDFSDTTSKATTTCV